MQRHSPVLLAAVLPALAGLALFTVPLWAQDDNSAPPDNGAPMQGDNSAPSPDQNQSQAPAADGSGDPDSSASFQTFYDSLGSQGTWIQSNDYGYVWQPTVSDPDWAPYTAGHWVYTDDGWTWASDESFGWATYHYGRWVNLDGTGWVWVPGYTWAPAWVSWRYGDGYAGWAPLPPDSFGGIDYFGDGFNASFGFHIGGDCDGFYGIGPAWYIFLPVNCLCYHSYHGYYHNRHDNFAIINHTTNVTNINVTRNNVGGSTAFAGGRSRRVTTGGPQLAQVNAVSQTPIQKISLVRSNQPGGGTLTQNSLALYAPHVRPAANALQPTRVGGTIGQSRINRGADITQPLTVNQRLAPAPASEEQIQAARVARDSAPASAKVLTDASTVKPVLQGPLTSFQPAPRESTPQRTYSSSPGAVYGNPASRPVYNTERTPAYSSGAPVTRTVPQAEESAPRVYSPGPVVTPSASPYPSRSTESGSGGAVESHTYTRPSAPSSSAPAATSYHSSGGGYSNSGGGGGSGAGGGNRGSSSGGSSGGNSPSSGGNSNRNH